MILYLLTARQDFLSVPPSTWNRSFQKNCLPVIESGAGQLAAPQYIQGTLCQLNISPIPEPKAHITCEAFRGPYVNNRYVLDKSPAAHGGQPTLPFPYRSLKMPLSCGRRQPSLPAWWQQASATRPTHKQQQAFVFVQCTFGWTFTHKPSDDSMRNKLFESNGGSSLRYHPQDRHQMWADHDINV